MDYPGNNALGGISAYGWDPMSGQMALGPYSFLPQAQGARPQFGASASSVGGPGWKDLGGGNWTTPQGTSYHDPSFQATSGSSTTSGPTANAGADFLGGVVSGKQLPFSPEWQAGQLSQQSDMSAAAEGAQNAQLAGRAAMGGASAFDPSFAAAQAGNMARRQTANQTAKRNIGQQAQTGNFAAQMDAANALNRNEMQRQQWAQQQAGNAMAFLPGMSGGFSAGSRKSQSTPGQYFGGFSSNATSNGRDPWGQGTTNPWAGNTQANYDDAHYFPDDYDQVMGPGGTTRAPSTGGVFQNYNQRY